MRILITLIFIYLLYRIVKASVYPSFKKGYKEKMDTSPTSVVDEMVKDPFCQVYLPKKQAIVEKVGNGWNFFCSEECRRKFKEKGKS